MLFILVKYLEHMCSELRKKTIKIILLFPKVDHDALDHYYACGGNSIFLLISRRVVIILVV